MKRIVSVLAVFAAILLFANCKKDNDSNSYNLTTYTETNGGDVFLYVNDQNKGKLPYVASGISDCGDSKALSVSLDPGTYAISVKNQQGEVKNAFTLQVAEDATITGSNYTLVQADKCILLSIDY